MTQNKKAIKLSPIQNAIVLANKPIKTLVEFQLEHSNKSQRLKDRFNQLMVRREQLKLVFATLEQDEKNRIAIAETREENKIYREAIKAGKELTKAKIYNIKFPAHAKPARDNSIEMQNAVDANIKPNSREKTFTGTTGLQD